MMTTHEVMLQLNHYARIIQQELYNQPVGSVGAQRFTELHLVFVNAAGALANGEVRELIERSDDEQHRQD
jgi:hypothetical protein